MKKLLFNLNLSSSPTSSSSSYLSNSGSGGASGGGGQQSPRAMPQSPRTPTARQHHHTRSFSGGNSSFSSFSSGGGSNNNTNNNTITPTKLALSTTMIQVDVEYRNQTITIGSLKYEYSGTSLVGGVVPHGTGRLCYPNGVCYEGEFNLGKRSGSGTLYWKRSQVTSEQLQQMQQQQQQQNSDSIEEIGDWSIMGLWDDNFPQSDCKFKVKCREYEYLGYLVLELPSDSNNSSNAASNATIDSNTFALLSLTDFKKTGEGEMHNFLSERYIGLFQDDLKHGYGIQVYSNKDRYFGGWFGGKLHGFGTFLYNDGTTFQGIFHAGLAKGNGTMFWPNGDSMTGDWEGSKVKNGVFSKGQCDLCQRVVLYRMSHAIKEGLKSINDSYSFDIERQREDKVSNGLKWRQYKLLNEADFKFEQQFLSELFTRKLINLEAFEECLNTLLQGYDDRERWFTSSAISFFLSFFENSYSVRNLVGNNKNIIICDAKGDIDSFIAFMQDEIWSYFSNLLDTAQVSEKLKDSCKRTCMLTIRDYIQEKLAITCFELYNRTYQDQDILANQKLDMLRSVLTLDMLEIPKQFHPSRDSNTEPYREAIDILSCLPRRETMVSKVAILNDVYESLTSEMVTHRAAYRQSQRQQSGNTCALTELEVDKQWEPSADDYTGVALYVFMKANIRNHHAQYHFISHYCDCMNDTGIIQLYEGVLKYIDDLDPALHTEKGGLISAYSLSLTLEDAFRIVRREARSDDQALSWLPHLLAFLSLEIGRTKHQQKLLEIPDSAFMNLKERLIKNMSLVEKLLRHADKLGFKVVHDPEKNNMCIELGPSTLPSHVYNELSIQTSKLVYGSDKDKRKSRADFILKRIIS